MSVKERINKAFDGIRNNPTLTVKEQLGYCGGIFGNTMGQDSYHTYGEMFIRDYSGVTSSMVQVKDNITEIITFLAPPVAGALYDRTRPAGKMTWVRMAIGSMPIPFAITSMLLFIVPFANPSSNFLWTLILGIIFTIVDNFFDIAMNTLGLRMVPNPKDRKNFFTLTSLASTLGSMLPGWIIPIFVDRAKTRTEEQWTYFFVALVFCVLGFMAMMSCYFCVKDKPVIAVGNKDEEKVHWNKDIILAILHNRPFIITQVSLICDAIRQVTYSTLQYMYKYTFDDYSMKPIIDAISGGLSYVGLALVPAVGNKVSARNMMLGSYSYTAFFYLIMSLFNIGFDLKRVRKLRYIVGICIGFAGMPNSAQGAARKIIVADSTDYMEWYSYNHYGVAMRSDGILSAAQSIFGKIISITKTNLKDSLMTLIGYEPSNYVTDAKDKINAVATGVLGKKATFSNKYVPTEKTMKGIFMVVTLCGLIGNIASAICFLFDNYTGKRKEEINAELAEIRAKRVGVEE